MDARITRWNDSRNTALNPVMKMPSAPITVVRRSHGSGTTYLVTNCLEGIGDEACKIACTIHRLNNQGRHFPRAVLLFDRKSMANEAESMLARISIKSVFIDAATNTFHIRAATLHLRCLQSPPQRRS